MAHDSETHHNCCEHETSMKPNLKDPVCGMDVDTDAEDFSTYKGKKFYFCGPGCREEC